MTLPFGVKPDAKPQQGNTVSAPARPMLWRKAAVASAVAAVFWVILYMVIKSGVFSLRDWAAQ